MERVTLAWIRPDGQPAVSVEFFYPTAQEASEVMERLLQAVVQAQEQS